MKMALYRAKLMSAKGLVSQVEGRFHFSCEDTRQILVRKPDGEMESTVARVPLTCPLSIGCFVIFGLGYSHQWSAVWSIHFRPLSYDKYKNLHSQACDFSKFLGRI